MVLSLALLLGVQSLSAATTITHTPLACLSSGTNTKIIAHVDGQPSSVRVYFHAIGQTCGEYYVDMRRDPKDATLYTAIMPIPAADADVVMYQIRAKNGSGGETAIAPVAATIRKECTSPALNAADLQAAQSIVLGLTQPNQKPTPCKFACNGITNYITANGDMKPNEECRLLLAALAGHGNTVPWYRTPEAELAGGAVVGAALGIGYENQKDKNHRAPSPARP
ncbi:MAG TPA: hypothetical protein VJ901_18495 [Thermoanaerobaculia bacterium]|nr:hypothetical protein [Thermoanaerobaculia bacterium]